MSDYYKTLGVSKDADAAAIKKAYRKLAVKYHPDKNSGDQKSENKFKEINAAYDVLKDDQKRAAYDRYGEEGVNGMGGAGAGGFGGGGFGGAGAGSFSDIFEDLFRGAGGGQTAEQQQNRGSDLQYNMEISLEEAYAGKKKTINIDTPTTCETCDGSGSKNKNDITNCSTCHGAGRVRVQQGFFMMERTCSTCGGAGHVIKNPCKKCHGEGRVRKNRSLVVSVPAGCENGTRIRLSGEGEAGARGGENGDLYIFINVKNHELFIREGADLHCNIPISVATAIIGGSMDAPTIDGSTARIKIPEGTQTGSKFRLKNKGMSVLRSSRKGDLYVHVAVETPVKISKKQRELINEFEKLGAKKSQPKHEKFIQTMKSFIN